MLHCSEVLVTLTGHNVVIQPTHLTNLRVSICVINKSYHAVNAYLIFYTMASTYSSSILSWLLVWCLISSLFLICSAVGKSSNLSLAHKLEQRQLTKMKVKEAGNTTETKYEVCNTRIFIQLFGFIKWSVITRYLQETSMTWLAILYSESLHAIYFTNVIDNQISLYPRVPEQGGWGFSPPNISELRWS